MGFKPLGEKPRWLIVYSMLQQAEVGDLVGYDDLGFALGLDPQSERHAIQMAVRKAAKRHETIDKRALDVVPNAGYRIVEASEHLALARRHQQKAGRALVAGHSKVVNVDLSGLDTETRRAFEIVARAFAVQLEVNRRVEGRQEKIEQEISAITASIVRHESRTDQELELIRDRLSRLEKGR